MARKARKLEELTEILDGHVLDEVEKADVSVLKEMAGRISMISDPRDASYVRHNLADIIMIAFFAILARADEWKEIETFGRKKKEWLQKFLKLEYGIPTDDTFRIVLSKINLNYVYGIVTGFLMEKVEEVVRTYGNQETGERELISCDGKATRSSKRNRTGKDGKKALNTLNAYSSEWGICLDQEFIEDKTNEITAMPELLKRLDLTDAIVTCDALNTQKDMAKAVTSGHGDYVAALKGNQKNFYEDVRDYFDGDVTAEIRKSAKNGKGNVSTKYKKTIEKEHSGVVTREYFLETEIGWLYGKDEWSGLKAIGLEHKTTEKDDPDTAVTHEDRYFICSIDNMDEFARSVRGHWGVENGLHWHLDYTFKDDWNTTTRENGAEAMQVFKKIGLALIKFAQAAYPKRTSLKSIRYMLSLDFEKEIENIFTLFNVSSLKENFFE